MASDDLVVSKQTVYNMVLLLVIGALAFLAFFRPVDKGLAEPLTVPHRKCPPDCNCNHRNPYYPNSGQTGSTGQAAVPDFSSK